MKRKAFITSIIPFGTVLSTIVGDNNEPEPPIIMAPYLKNGDCIGITCVAGFITLADIEPALSKIKEWGFEVNIGETIGKREFTFGGTDEERIKDFQQMLDDKKIPLKAFENVCAAIE